jgi:glycosyltransferase involved in cell wall biosynthesis
MTHDLFRRLGHIRQTDSTFNFSYSQKLLYVVNHCFPFSSDGYAVRTHGLAKGLLSGGCKVIVASRPGMSWNKAGKNGAHFDTSHVIDSVRYVHTFSLREAAVEEETYLSRSVDVFSEMIAVFKPQAVMAASNWRNALPAAVAAREAGLPFFYEVRGFWEISNLSREPGSKNSEPFRQVVARETAVAQAATGVFTLNRFMRDELVRRGVSAKKIKLVPNGFSVKVSSMTNGDELILKQQLGIKSHYVVGYVGSFNSYEGIEDLIRAFAGVVAHEFDVSLLLVGSSAEGYGQNDGRCMVTQAYRQLADQLGLGNRLIMPGRVPADQVPGYYALMDVVVIPRRPDAVSELVSPMKPMEAAAHGKRVLLSDVGPLKDLLTVGPHFTCFQKGSVESLTDNLISLLSANDFEPGESAKLAQWTWPNIVKPMLDAFSNDKI